MENFLKLVPWWGWLIFCGAVISGKAVYDHYQREIGKTQCEANYAAEKARADKLQTQIDGQAAAQNAPVMARYNALNEALASYDRSPIAIPGCGRAPDDIVRAVNASHARKNL